jgi:ribonuclease Y
MEALIVVAIACVAAVAAWAMKGRTRTHPAGPIPDNAGRGPSPVSGVALVGSSRAATVDTREVEEYAEAAAAVLDSREEEALREQRDELLRLEERVHQREQSLEARIADLAGRERSVADRMREAERRETEAVTAAERAAAALERASGMSRQQARQALLREVEEDARHEKARVVRQVDEEARREAGRRSRNILAACMQRLAAGHASETTVSLVSLPSDDMKGRIIGREGRNIRALENITGVDFIIDETPSAVVLSAFDPVRREIAKLALQKLVQDGRIHPARIEEAYYQAKAEIDNHVMEQGEQALFEANVHAMHPELVKLLGRLKFRTSYGQNVLDHSIEVARLAAMIADELGASAKTARRAALLHDIGKAVTHEVEGPHALVGGELARRYGEPEAVAHAMEAHHNEVELRTVEAVIVQTADSLSGARPGARGESLDQYVKRLKNLEEIATRHAGVEKVYAVQAGREIRVMVSPDAVDDDAAALISHEIARAIEREVEFPGQIKVTVIRESRSVDVAR